MHDENMAWPAGIKRTVQREKVLAALHHSDSPMSAADIYENIEKGTPPVSLSTVYRILEFFTEKGIVRKTAVLENGTAVYDLSGSAHKHYAVCVNCHKIIAMNNCPMKEFVPELEDGGFHVLGHKLEMYGYCKDCDAAINKPGKEK